MGHPPGYINKIMRQTLRVHKYTMRNPLGEGHPIHISSMWVMSTKFGSNEVIYGP